MKKKYLIAMACVLAGSLHAQSFNELLTSGGADANGKPAGLADANKYLNEYLRPYGEGQIYNLTTGWYHSAKTHRKLGFDVSVSIHAAFVPKEKESFVFNNSDYSTLKLADGTRTSASLPTFMGGGTSMQLRNTATNSTISAPPGIAAGIKKAIPNLSLAVPLPVAQISVGLIKKTDIKLRYFPTTNIGNVKAGVFGVGVQHNIGQYIPVFDKLPLVHLSALAAYNKLTASYLPGETQTTYLTTSNTSLDYSVNTFTVQAIGSVKLLMLELYAGAGFYSGTSNIDLNGKYDFTYAGNAGKASLTNPISLNYKASGLTATAGAKFSIAFFKFYADYTFAQYKNLNLGVAFSFR